MTEDGPAGCCAHSKVERRRVTNGSGTIVYREYWVCVDCNTEFSPANVTMELKRKACYCGAYCMAPRIMGCQMPCLDPTRHIHCPEDALPKEKA
jgi:hypothetical protein